MRPNVESFYDPATFTFTYVVYDTDGGHAAIVDPVLDFDPAAARTSTASADRVLETRGDIEIIPDVLCNAGGVVVSYFEWLQNLQNYYWTRDEVLSKLFTILDRAKISVENQKRKFQFTRRLAALTLGIARVAEAKESRGLFP